jgi:kinesin family protein 5
LQQGTFSEKDDQLRQILAKLDAIDSDSAVSTLKAEDITQIRRQLAEGQSVMRDTVDRLRQKQEENEMVARRKDEIEGRLAALETEYEELLGNETIIRSHRGCSRARRENHSRGRDEQHRRRRVNG